MTEHGLIRVVTELAARSLQVEAVKRAEAAAQALVGIVVTSEAEAMMTTDQLALITAGEKALKRAESDVLEQPDVAAFLAALDDAKTMRKAIAARLAAGKDAGKRAVGAFLEAERARTERENRERETAARKAAEVAAADARLLDEDVPPPPEVAPVAAPRMVRSAAGAIHTQKRLRCEMVNPHECDPTWLRLDDAPALDWARYAIKTEQLADPGVGHERCVESRGVRYWYEETMVQRSTR